MTKSYSEIPDPPEKVSGRTYPSFAEWIAFCVMCFLLGALFGAIIAKADPLVVATPAPIWAAVSDYPDKNLTPGVTRTVDLKTLCTAGSTKDARHVTQAMKNQVFERYGYKKGSYKPGDYEIDHFISLENGGANDIMNLWPEHYCPIGNDPTKTNCWGAREKDKVETQLHRWLCQNKITLHDDQVILQTDWIKCYLTMQQGKVCTP